VTAPPGRLFAPRLPANAGSCIARTLAAGGPAAQFSRMLYAPEGVSPEVIQLQVRRYREMSAAEKLACADALWELAWDATQAGIRLRNPAYDDAAVTRAARIAFNRAAD